MWSFCSSSSTGNHTDMWAQQEHTAERSHGPGMPAHIKEQWRVVWSTTGNGLRESCSCHLLCTLCHFIPVPPLARNKVSFCWVLSESTRWLTAVRCLDPLQWGNIPVNYSNLRWQMVSPGCPQNMVLTKSSGCSVLKSCTNKFKGIVLI